VSSLIGLFLLVGGPDLSQKIGKIAWQRAHLTPFFEDVVATTNLCQQPYSRAYRTILSYNRIKRLRLGVNAKRTVLS
jgi:hypothetical protein